MSDTVKALHLLENKLHTLLSNYNFLKEENEVLLKNNAELLLLLKKKEQQLVNHQKEYNLLKIARTINGSNKNIRNTKLKINALIREIDRCIVQLNS